MRITRGYPSAGAAIAAAYRATGAEVLNLPPASPRDRR